MAGVDYFLDCADIPGESTDDKYKGKIEVSSFSWGETNAGTQTSGGGGGAGKVMAQDFHFTKKLDKSSTLLAQSCANGKHYSKATLICRKAGTSQLVYYTIEMNDFIVSSYQIGGSSGGDIIPTEQVSLNVSKMQWAYTMQDEKGAGKPPDKKGYDFSANKGF